VIETVNFESSTLAIILRHSYKKEGLEFFTPDDFSQQLAYMNRNAGYLIPPHVHHPVRREVQYTKEVLLIKSGKVRVDFYTDAQVYLESRILDAGDVILLAFGGHGFQMLEDTEIIEVKQGPYAGHNDKCRFLPVDDSQVRLIGKAQ
jgi:mannose-6-phosphate isomerase-like protein (cupin superfamily)